LTNISSIGSNPLQLSELSPEPVTADSFSILNRIESPATATKPRSNHFAHDPFSILNRIESPAT